MITKTIYIRYLSNIRYTYLIPEDYVNDFNTAYSEDIDVIWKVGSFEVELHNIKYLYSLLECIMESIFHKNCIIYMPKESSPNPTVKDFIIPFESGRELYPTITDNNHGNPPLI